MFKNLTVYRIAPGWSPDRAALEQALPRHRFAPCAPTQPQSSGWVEPRGIAHAPLLEVVGGQWLLKLQMEQRVLPGAVVKRRTEEIAAQVEQATGRAPGRKQTKEIKEQAVQELLPMAFTKQASVRVWIDPKAGWLVTDAGSQGKADEVITQLVKVIDSLAVSQVNTEVSPATAMAQWLLEGEPPAGFAIDRDCELKSPDEMKSVVRYARHPLDTDDVRQHIAAGKRPTRLAMTWEGRVSFMLTEGLQLRKLAFLDVVFEDRPDTAGKDDDTFDADAALATGELGRLIPDLIDALGGELQQPGFTAPDAPHAAPKADEATPAPAGARAPATAPSPDSVAPWDDVPAAA